VDQAVGVTEDTLGVDREAALDEEVVVELAELLSKVSIADRFGLAPAGKA
jgi:hypothetical protein